jgi:hypothetical protein
MNTILIFYAFTSAIIKWENKFRVMIHRETSLAFPEEEDKIVGTDREEVRGRGVAPGIITVRKTDRCQYCGSEVRHSSKGHA